MKLWNRLVRTMGGKTKSLEKTRQSSRRYAQRKYDLETLESRVLLSGDVMPTVIVPAVQDSFSVTQLLTKEASSFSTMAPPSPSSVPNAGALQEVPTTTPSTPADTKPSLDAGETDGTKTDRAHENGNAEQSSPRTYFISPSGNDANDGSSPTLAFKTLAAINKREFAPGDIIALEGGASFAGTLVIHNSGTENQPIKITSFATSAGDRSEILAGEGDGIVLQNVERVSISNLKITGAGASVNEGQGIMLLHDDANDRRLEGIRIDEVESSGFRYAGIAMYTGGTLRYGYQDVRVTHADVHDNGFAGMWMGSAPGNYPNHPETYAYENVYVGYSRFHNNHGLDIGQQTGNGVLFKDVNGGVIEHCLAYNNGTLNRAPNGPVGIWAIYSNNVIIQFNESFNNHTQGGDGNGFDLDGGTTNSILQYNYSHDNDGPGYLVYQFPDAYRSQSVGNIVRYNISENDVRKGAGEGAIDIRALGSPEIDTQVYGNTVYVDNAGWNPANIAAIRTSGNLSNVRIFNNFLMTTGGVRLVDAQSAVGAALFQGNRYSSDRGPVNIAYAGVTYKSLEEWRTATNQESDSLLSKFSASQG